MVLGTGRRNRAALIIRVVAAFFPHADIPGDRFLGTISALTRCAGTFLIFRFAAAAPN